MKPGIPLFFAFRHFRKSRRLISAATSVALSLIPLILVLVITNGMIEGITRRYVEVGTYHLQAQGFDEQLEKDEALALAGELKRLKGVLVAVPEYKGTALAYSEKGRTGVSVRAVPGERYEEDSLFREFMTFSAGSFDLAERDSVILSTGVAESLSAGVGDRIKLLTAMSVPGRASAVIKPSILTVTGVFSSGYQELDALTVYVNFDKGASLFRDSSNLIIGIKLDSADVNSLNSPTLNRMRWIISGALPQGFYVYTWYDLEKSLYKSLVTTKNLLVFIMVLILCVASVNISSALIMLVTENSQAIAILKSTGGSPNLITQSFLLTGFIIGFAGTAAGLLIGLLISVNINPLIQ
ncbi:MAG: ABC transporter permease, partial [Spirochaetales bacterium]